MKRFCSRLVALGALALTLGAARDAAAGSIYVVSASGSNGQIYKYDNMSELSAQTPDNITGDLVATHAAYFNDQAVTMDFNTGIVYRIANGGNVFQYPTLDDWLANTNSTNVSIGANPYSNGNLKRVNDASFDGATGGYYAVGAPMANSSTPGDILIYNGLNDFRAATPNSTLVAGYNAARVMFWNSQGVAGTTINMDDIVANYFQISGAGRLEGFVSLAAYAAAPNNRINMGLEGAFGGTNTTGFNAIVAFAVPVPEPTSMMLCFGAAFGLVMVRRR
jgi:hypothetical protein